MKHNLLLSYCTYLSFYLLLKSEGKTSSTIREHPVIFKITSLKTLIDSLQPIDEKVAPKLLNFVRREEDLSNLDQDGSSHSQEEELLSEYDEEEGSMIEDGENEDSEDMDVDD